MPNHVSASTRILLLAVFILALLARLVPGPRTIDDSFITFRYARNILAGNGFLYNPGEHVLGTTTPLYTFLLTGLGALSGGTQAPFAQIALLVNAVADAGTCLLLVFLGRRLGARLAGWGAAVVWAIAPFSVTFAIGGLETSVYVFLLTATVAAYLVEKRVLAAFLGALALLTRPDALILLGPLALDRFLIMVWPHPNRETMLKNLRSAVPEILAFLIPTLGWIIFATLYFGSPLPHSIAAKSLAYRLSPDAGLIRLLQHYATPFMDDQTFGMIGIVIGLLLYPFLFLIGARQAWGETRRSWPFLAYPWLYFATFAIANPLIFRWYLTPPLPAYILIILIGVERLVRDILKMKIPPAEQKPAARPIANAALVFCVLLLPVILSLRAWDWRPDHGLARPAPDMAWYKLELLYHQAADSLTPEIKQAKQVPVLAAGDVGVLGFFTNVRILDTVGLNSPLSSSYYPLDPALYTINYAIPPKLILDQQPDYIVMLEVYGREGLLKDPLFQQAYHLRQKIPTDIYGSDGMLIFARNSAQ